MCLTLCSPIDGSPPGSPVPGILQARTLEWVAISFSSAWKWKVKVKSLSRVWLLATPWTAAYQAPPSVGFSRQEYWSGEVFKLNFSRKEHWLLMNYQSHYSLSVQRYWLKEYLLSNIHSMDIIWADRVRVFFQTICLCFRLVSSWGLWGFHCWPVNLIPVVWNKESCPLMVCHQLWEIILYAFVFLKSAAAIFLFVWSSLHLQPFSLRIINLF